MKKLFSMLLLTLAIAGKSYSTCTLPAPGNFKSQNVSSCKFDVKWNPVNGAVGYLLKYKLTTDASWTSLNLGLVTSYDFIGIASNSTYKLKVSALCSNGDVGAYTNILTINTPICSKPVNVSVTNITTTTAIINWEAPCGETNFKLKFRQSGSSTWITKNNLLTTSYLATGLLPATTYQLKVQANCGGGSKSAFTALYYFTTFSNAGNYSGKNVLLVIIDDARFDSYTATGGPAFFADTNISRIADEGANFKLSFPAQSQCAPSRASILTGVYPHMHGITNNPNNDNVGLFDTITLPTFVETLDDHGYYTGLIGKYHISSNAQPGFDYWMENHKVDYFDAKYYFKDFSKKITGHQTDVLTDSAIGFFHKVPSGQPFFLWLGYRAPHTPYDARTVDDGIFNNDTMPFPSNFAAYDENYPDFLYDCHNSPDSADLVESYKGYYELLEGVEVDLGRIWNELETMGIMDSTLIIFMSDNGYMMGEHHFKEKQLAYEESIKIPIFMRYPKMISAGKTVKKEMAMNIDIASTVLDFAGIQDTFGQGISLLKMINGEASRTEFLYEWNHQDCVPDMRAIRSLNCKYVQYHCSDITEEFFDLNLDKRENTNQIFNPAYADSVELYRDKMAYWRSFYQDTTYDTLYTCSLSNIQQRTVSDEDGILSLLNVYPNPTRDHLTIHFMSGENTTSTLRIINAMGVVLYEDILADERQEITKSMSTESFASGNYFVVLQHGGHVYQKEFVVQR